jgi:hypothetical protein
VIYAARSKYFRAAYSQYLSQKLPFLFGILKSKKCIANNGMVHPVRRTASLPQLGKSKRNPNKKVDVKIMYSLVEVKIGN